MSVLCCQMPEFAVALTCQQEPELQGKPLALLGPDEKSRYVSPIAREHGVFAQMTPRQMQTRCPDIVLQPLDEVRCQQAHSAFLDVVTAWELPVEEMGLGRAYVDLHHVADARDDVQGLAAELGRRLRSELDLAPALGWDHGKFTARVAASSTEPGRMKLVNRTDEVAFLTPKPIHLLPLPQSVLSTAWVAGHPHAGRLWATAHRRGL